MNTEDLYRLLRTGHIQAQGIVDTVADPMLVLDSSLCIQSASRAFFETFKVERYETIGRQVYEIGNGQWDIPELRRLLLDVIPKASAVVDYQVEHDFPGLGKRTMLLTARTLFHPDGAGHTMLLSIVDGTDRQRRDVAKDMLFGELRHRMKNLLGVTQSIARHAPTKGQTAEEYRDAFLGRFAALIEAQDLAFAEEHAGGLRELLERILAPYWLRPEAVAIEPGAECEMKPRTISSLALVLHEMATNAAKYGALSEAEGRVAVSWQLEAENTVLRLKWVESGGPVVTPPTATGYGTKLIQSTIRYGLRGTVEQEYAVAGLQTEIVIPLGSAPLPG